MTVKELIALLQTFDNDLVVINTRHSDLGYLTPNEISVVEAVPQSGGDWLMRAPEPEALMSARHYSRSSHSSVQPRKFLHFARN